MMNLNYIKINNKLTTEDFYFQALQYQLKKGSNLSREFLYKFGRRREDDFQCINRFANRDIKAQKSMQTPTALC